MKHGKLQWHPAFGAALRITLRDEMDHLEMREEYLLGRKPLQMDILLIKNPKNIPVRKSIGQIFREHNIIEYKSPDDYVNILYTNVPQTKITHNKTEPCFGKH